MLRVLFQIVLFAALTLDLLHASPVPAELDRALKLFRAEGARGWAFVQTTESGGKSLVEHYDPAKPEFSRWTLLEKRLRSDRARVKGISGTPQPPHQRQYRTQRQGPDRSGEL